MLSDRGNKKKHQKDLWNMLDESRNEFSMEPVSAIKYLRDREADLDIDDLMLVLERFGAGDVSAAIAQFFFSLISSRQRTRVLHPTGNFGLLGAWIANKDPSLSVDIVSRRLEAKEIVACLGLDGLTHYVGSLDEVGNQLTETYDAIVSSGPFGFPPGRRSYDTPTGDVQLRDDSSCLLLADVSNRLSDDGVIVSVVPASFAFTTRPDGVRANLERFGLHLSALLSMRPGAIIGTRSVSYLAVVSRRQERNLFVAEIPDDIEGQEALVQRLRNRKQGPTASQGRLVNPTDFRGMAALEARERYDEIGKNKGLESIAFGSAICETCVPRRGASTFQHCEEHDHAVYLPEMATTEATTKQDALPPKLKSYLQLLVNPMFVLPEYLAGWLNAPMGQAFRQSAMVGDTIPRIRRSVLEERKLYLPTMEDQKIATQAVREIHRLRSDLSELESRLWDQPGNASSVAEAVGKVNHEDRFSEWIETLPFPLASILRSYDAIDHSPKEKYERLLHFFEAFTEFCAAIHLSAFKAASSTWNQQCKQITKVLEGQNLSLQKASFGTWRAIAEVLGGKLKGMLNEEDGRVEACALYSTASVSPLEVLASSEIRGILQRVNSCRNRWTGHGGAVTNAEAEERHQSLSNELATLRSIIGLKFDQYQLVEPCECVILEGPIFRCRIRRAMGSNPQLRHDDVDLITPATTGRLYLHNPGHNQALELLPLILVYDEPQPSSYFYNRIESSTPRLISYQFAAQSEISSDNKVLLDLLEDFESDDAIDMKENA